MAIKAYSGEELTVRLMNLTSVPANPATSSSAVTSLAGQDEIQFSVVNPDTLAVVSTSQGTNSAADDWWATLSMPTVTAVTRYQLQAKANITSRDKYWHIDVDVWPVANPDA